MSEKDTIVFVIDDMIDECKGCVCFRLECSCCSRSIKTSTRLMYRHCDDLDKLKRNISYIFDFLK